MLHAQLSHLETANGSFSAVQADRKLTGIMNFTNPGAISHNEILQLYKEHVDPGFTWQNFSVEEQAKVIKAPRSNNLLDTKRVRPQHSMFSLSNNKVTGRLLELVADFQSVMRIFSCNHTLLLHFCRYKASSLSCFPSGSPSSSMSLSQTRSW